jgi:hypothetical protein
MMLEGKADQRSEIGRSSEKSLKEAILSAKAIAASAVKASPASAPNVLYCSSVLRVDPPVRKADEDYSQTDIDQKNRKRKRLLDGGHLHSPAMQRQP